MLDRLKGWARHIRIETYALLFACEEPCVPWYARALVAFVVIHTFSPIDLIPDFIPVLGYLDDLIITPLGLALALRLIPDVVMEEARIKAEADLGEREALKRRGLMIVVGLWIVGLSILVVLAVRLVG